RTTGRARRPCFRRSSPFNQGGEESVARMNAGNCSQIRARKQRPDILPAHFARLPQLLQLSLTINDFEFRRALERSLYHRFVFLALQRTRGINESSAHRKLRERGLQDGHLPRLKIAQVFFLEPPLDLWITCQSAGART